MSKNPDHVCPGGCGVQVPYTRLSCQPCWVRLPAPLRTEVTSAYRRRDQDRLRHLRAVRDAITWFKADQGG